jgi:hypothetical protein
MEISVMMPAKDLDPREQLARPWILTTVYWNDVAKDVVKALCVALAIYLGGAAGGIFKVHPQIIAAALIGVVAILSDVVLHSVLGRAIRRNRLTGAIGGGVIGGVIGSICGGLESAIIAITWPSAPTWVPTLVSVVIILFAASMARRILRRRIEYKMIISIIEAEATKHPQ